MSVVDDQLVRCPLCPGFTTLSAVGLEAHQLTELHRLRAENLALLELLRRLGRDAGVEPLDDGLSAEVRALLDKHGRS